MYERTPDGIIYAATSDGQVARSGVPSGIVTAAPAAAGRARWNRAGPWSWAPAGVSAVCSLRAEDLDLAPTPQRPYGAITWPGETDKQGRQWHCQEAYQHPDDATMLRVVTHAAELREVRG